MNRILKSNLVLYLPLYEADGGSFISRDAWGHLCVVNGAIWTPQGRSFDGGDELINCGSAAILDNIGTTGDYRFTVVAWIKPTSLGENNLGRIIDKDSFVFLMQATQRVALNIYFGGVAKQAILPNNSVPFGSWTFVVAEHDGANIKISTNGGAWITGDAVVGAIDVHAANSLLIGDNASSNRCFDGIIGEIRIYNHALLTQEIQNLYIAAKWRYQ